MTKKPWNAGKSIGQKKPKKIKGAITIGILDNGETLLEIKNVLVVKKPNGDIVFRDSEGEYEIAKVTLNSCIISGAPEPLHFKFTELQDSNKW